MRECFNDSMRMKKNLPQRRFHRFTKDTRRFTKRECLNEGMKECFNGRMFECFNGERFRATSFLSYPPTWARNNTVSMHQQMERNLELRFGSPKLLNSGLSLRGVKRRGNLSK